MNVKMSKNAPIAHEILLLEAGPRLMKPTIIKQTKMPIRPLR